jgi:predicted component of type VI protein secretion system
MVTSWYLIGTRTREHEIPQTQVLAWIRGYLACLAENDETSQLIDQIISKIAPVPGESISQACYRTLKICHDQQIIVYRGIRRE